VVASAQESAAKAEASSQSSSPVNFELRNDGGRIEFFATGRPSALRIHGKGKGPDGTITVAEGVVTGALAFDLDSLETGIGLRDRHMKETYLETSRYPRASLTLKQLDASRLPQASSFAPVTVPFEGTLSLHGVERPVTGQAKVSRDGARISSTATFAINLGEFGIAVPSYLGITVAEKVEVKATFSALVEHGRAVAER
jgi:polyisoprenoid-binding protein YceI